MEFFLQQKIWKNIYGFFGVFLCDIMNICNKKTCSWCLKKNRGKLYNLIYLNVQEVNILKD